MRCGTKSRDDRAACAVAFLERPCRERATRRITEIDGQCHLPFYFGACFGRYHRPPLHVRYQGHGAAAPQICFSFHFPGGFIFSFREYTGFGRSPLTALGYFVAIRNVSAACGGAARAAWRRVAVSPTPTGIQQYNHSWADTNQNGRTRAH